MIILASSSPTRGLMLREAGLEFTAVAPAVDERALANENPRWLPEELAAELGKAKAQEVSRRYPGATVIGADQVLALGSQVFSKPKGMDDCRKQLLTLRGKAHRLISAVCCARDGTVIWHLTDHAELIMREFSDQFLESYLEAVGSGCTSSVGGYKIEGRGIQLFDSVSGNHFTILGLPLLPLLDFLRHCGELET